MTRNEAEEIGLLNENTLISQKAELLQEIRKIHS